MKIIIEAPENEMENYLAEMLKQYREGFIRGYVDKQTQWEKVSAQ